MMAFIKSLSLLFTGVAFLINPLSDKKTKPANTVSIPDQTEITFPDNVKKIIDAKCMGCHKPDARNEKARKKLQWEKVSKMNKEEQEHLIAELFEILEEGKMPPARAVERRPQMKLTEEETKILISWVEKEEKRLKGEQ